VRDVEHSIDGVVGTVVGVLAYQKDDAYVKERPHFCPNGLAADPDQLSCEENPGLLAFAKSSGPSFAQYEELKAAGVTERRIVYRAIAKQVWNPEDILAVATVAA